MNCQYCNTVLPKRVMACPACAAPVAVFTGRTWLVPVVLDWLEHRAERIFLLTGNPGSGKSAAMAWLAGYGRLPVGAEARQQLLKIRAQAPAIHYCLANDPARISPRAFAESIANQLTQTLPGFGKALAAALEDRVQVIGIARSEQVASGANLTGVSIQCIDLGGLGDGASFDRAFVQPLQKLYQAGYDQPLLILVDALDEAETYDGTRLTMLLAAGLSSLPPRVRLLASTRPDPPVLNIFQDARSIDLIKDAPPGVDDVGLFVYEQLAEQSDQLRTVLAQKISLASEGIFLYAYLVLQDQDLLLRLSHALDLATLPLPKGLGGFYNAFLTRQLHNDRTRWFEKYKPVLGLIAVAQGQGLRETQIKAILGHDVVEIIEACKQYLDGNLPQGPFRPFHKSLADFLLEDRENIAYHINPVDMHRCIADYYWKNLKSDWSTCDAYGLVFLASHLVEAGDERQLILINPGWMDVRFKTSGNTYYSFIADINRIWKSILERRDPAGILALVQLLVSFLNIEKQIDRYTHYDLQTLVWLGLEQQALAHSRLRKTPSGRSNGLFAVYCALEDRSSPDLSIYAEVLHQAQLIPATRDKQKMLEQAIMRFPKFGKQGEFNEKLYYSLLDEVFKIIDAMDPAIYPETLVVLTERLAPFCQTPKLDHLIEVTLKIIMVFPAAEYRAEWITRLMLTLEKHDVEIQPDRYLRLVEENLAMLPVHLPHILSRGAASIADMLQNTNDKPAVKIAFKHLYQATALKLLDQAEDRVINYKPHIVAESWTADEVDWLVGISWIAAGWDKLADHPRADKCLKIVRDRLVQKSLNGASWPPDPGRGFPEEIPEALAWAGRFSDAYEFAVGRFGRLQILLAEASYRITYEKKPKVDQLFAEIKKSLWFADRKGEQNFNHYLQILEQSKQLSLESDPEIYFRDPKAISIQAYWTARAGGQGPARKLLEMALNSPARIGNEDQGEAVLALVKALVKNEEMNLAQVLAQSIQQNQQKLLAEIELGKGYMVASKEHEADTCFRSASTLLESITPYQQRIDLAKFLARNLLDNHRDQIIQDLLEFDENKNDWHYFFFKVLVESHQLVEAHEVLKREKKLQGITYFRRHAYELIDEIIKSGDCNLAYDLLQLYLPFEKKKETPVSGGITISLPDLKPRFKLLARLVGSYSKRGNFAQAAKVLDELSLDINSQGNYEKSVFNLAVLGWSLVGIKKTREADQIFLQIEHKILDNKFLYQFETLEYLEALVCAGYVSRAVKFARRMLNTPQYSSDEEKGLFLEGFSSILGKARFFEQGMKMFNDVGCPSYYQRLVIKNLFDEAIRQRDLTHAVLIAQSFPAWLEDEHRMNMLPKLASLLAADQRFDDIRKLVPLANSEYLQNILLTKLAIGYARLGSFSEAFELMKSTSINQTIIFIEGSFIGFERIKKGLGMKAVRKAIETASWMHPDWLEIHRLLVSSKRSKRKEATQ